MRELPFVWDEAKNRVNQQERGMAFEETRIAFLDENAHVYFDPDHSYAEDRFILLGIGFQLRFLIVCHCYREGELIVRLISARKADKWEQEDYWS